MTSPRLSWIQRYQPASLLLLAVPVSYTHLRAHET